MHERALMDDLVRKVLAVAEAEDATSVARIRVRLGALSHFTPEHFREHWVDATRGTAAEGAEVEATLDDDLAGEAAQGVVLEAVEVRQRDRRNPVVGAPRAGRGTLPPSLPPRPGGTDETV